MTETDAEREAAFEKKLHGPKLIISLAITIAKDEFTTNKRVEDAVEYLLSHRYENMCIPFEAEGLEVLEITHAHDLSPDNDCLGCNRVGTRRPCHRTLCAECYQEHLNHEPEVGIFGCSVCSVAYHEDVTDRLLGRARS